MCNKYNKTEETLLKQFLCNNVSLFDHPMMRLDKRLCAQSNLENCITHTSNSANVLNKTLHAIVGAHCYEINLNETTTLKKQLLLFYCHSSKLASLLRLKIKS